MSRDSRPSAALKRLAPLVCALAFFRVLALAQTGEIAPLSRSLQAVGTPIMPSAAPGPFSFFPAQTQDLVLTAPIIQSSIETSRLVSRFAAPVGTEGSIDLSAIDPGDTSELGKRGKNRALEQLIKDKERLNEFQERLYADGKQSVLVVLQGMDTSGKDGTIKHVLRGINPQGVEVASFKKPTPEEAAHHFLWRLEKALVDKGIVKKDLTGNGRIGVFNRSQYEDILVPSVYKSFSPEEIEARYEEINQWEKKLAASGVVIVKLFLHISKAEQKSRLEARIDNKDKNWKFSAADLESREKWDEFQSVYAKILARTNTAWAPWRVIPADKKWYRNFIVGRILRKTLKAMGLKFPRAPEGLESVVITD